MANRTDTLRCARRWLLRAALAMWAVTPAIATTASCPDRLTGINLVPLPTGWYNGAVEMKFPTEVQIIYYKNVGMNAIRLPIHWEEMQPALFADLNPRYVAHARAFLDLAERNGMPVLIDLHNYARYRDRLIGSPEVPADAFKDIWARLAGAFANHAAVAAWGLMNEPHHTNGLWHRVAQAGVDGIRSIDSARPIYVGGDGWSNTQNWPSANPEPFVTDPVERIVYEGHIYFDDDFSGRYKTPIAAVASAADLAARAEQRVQPFLAWLTKYQQRGAIGETGVPMDDPRWLAALEKFLDLTDAACVDWFIWAGGAWRPTYELSHEPIDGKDRPQIEVLRRRLN
ncbi:MAG: cellulase family glycosylhydrolase [Propionivibrio sp.]